MQESLPLESGIVAGEMCNTVFAIEIIRYSLRCSVDMVHVEDSREMKCERQDERMLERDLFITRSPSRFDTMYLKSLVTRI
jgi:hypothetical protein